MKKLTLTALIASTLFITACEQAQDASEGAMDKASEMTHDAAEHAGHGAEAGKDMIDKAAEMANDTMEGVTGAGFHTGTKGHPVGTQEDINALHDEYHEKMKAHQ